MIDVSALNSTGTRPTPERTGPRQLGQDDFLKLQIQNALEQIVAQQAAHLEAMRRIGEAHQVETVGAKLRDMMPWIKKNRLVYQSKN